jgi:hypothetical protein
VELGLKVNPEKLATFILLCGEDVSSEVVSIEKPPPPENVQDVKNREGVGLLDPCRGRAVSTGVRRGRGSYLQLLVGKREDRGGKLASSRGRGSHHQKEMVVVRVQEGMVPLPPFPSSSTTLIITNFSAPEDHNMTSKCPKNRCPYCSKGGHFGQECKTPHIYYTDQGYCKLRQKTNCKYPHAHGQHARTMQKKPKKEQQSTESLEYIIGIDEQELAFDTGSILFDMDWSN